MKNQLSTECICTIPGQSMFGITHILLETFLLFMIWWWCSSSTFYKLDYILGLLGCAFAVARCKINRLQGSTGGEKFKLKSYFSQHIENSLYVCSTQIMALFDNNLFCKSYFLVYYNHFVNKKIEFILLFELKINFFAHLFCLEKQRARQVHT